MIIDIHTHLFESAAAFPQAWLDVFYGFGESKRGFKRAIMGDEAFERWQADFDQSGRVEALIADMDEAGIDKSVVLPLDWAIVCQQEPKISVWRTNEYVAEAQRKYPDRIIGFVGVDPLRGEEAIKLLETGVKEWDLKGVKIMPAAFKVTDPKVQAFMSKVDELRIPALFHMGSDPHPFVIRHGDPADLDTLSSWYPKMKMVAAHCAMGYEDVLISFMWFYEGLMYTDTAMLQYELMQSPWHFTLHMRYLMDRIPRSLVIGSDWPAIKTPPLLTHKEWFDAFRNLKIPEQFLQLGLGIRDFSQEEKGMILGENARSLLGIE